MAQVNVTISGRSYRIACEDGQEDHLIGLADDLDRSIAEMRDRFGEIGDQRLTVMAAITLADRNSEIAQRLERVQAEMAGLEEARAAIVEREAAAEAQLVKVIDSLSERIEAMARTITSGGAGARD